MQSYNGPKVFGTQLSHSEVIEEEMHELERVVYTHTPERY